jgi:hypothetical protein
LQRLLPFVHPSSERTPEPARRDCSFPEKRESDSARLLVVRSTSLPEVVEDFCFDSLRRLLAAASSRVEQADGGLGHDCPIPPRGEA